VTPTSTVHDTAAENAAALPLRTNRSPRAYWVGEAVTPAGPSVHGVALAVIAVLITAPVLLGHLPDEDHSSGPCARVRMAAVLTNAGPSRPDPAPDRPTSGRWPPPSRSPSCSTRGPVPPTSSPLSTGNGPDSACLT
jgi:hypothetical protein